MSVLRPIVLAAAVGLAISGQVFSPYPSPLGAQEPSAGDVADQSESDPAESAESKDAEDAAASPEESGGDHGDGEFHHGEGDTHGEAHGDEVMPPILSFDPGAAIANLLIFFGVLFVLGKFVWPVILGGLRAREDKIHGDLQAAEKANLEAKGLLADYQAKLDDAANQVQSLLAEAGKDAEASGQRIVADAKAEAERQRERAVAEIETAKKVALSDLATQTSDMAIQAAKQVVGRELKAEDHADLIRQSLDRIPSHN